jgi:2-polyprenyl-3-methyl-5-hydroxy-6-metoxy-1,4-benzoquinol methylase
MNAVLKTSAAEEKVTMPFAGETPRRPIRLRLFSRSQRVWARAHRFIEALHTGFWLGVLDRNQLNTIVFQHYEAAELYRTAAHNLHGFFPWESDLMRDYFKGCRSVVVAAAGGGREMIALARAGVRVEGFECNLQLVERCKEFLAEVGVSGRILNAEPDQVPSGLQKYDGAIVGYGALAHIVGRGKRINFLRDLKSHLHPGAPLMLSVGRRLEGAQYYNWIYQIARAIRFLRGGDDAIELGDDLLDCFTHRFEESELHSELQEAGFTMLTSVETPEIYAVAQLRSD